MSELAEYPEESPPRGWKMATLSDEEEDQDFDTLDGEGSSDVEKNLIDLLDASPPVAETEPDLDRTEASSSPGMEPEESAVAEPEESAVAEPEESAVAEPEESAVWEPLSSASLSELPKTSESSPVVVGPTENQQRDPEEESASAPVATEPGQKKKTPPSSSSSSAAAGHAEEKERADITDNDTAKHATSDETPSAAPGAQDEGQGTEETPPPADRDTASICPPEAEDGEKDGGLMVVQRRRWKDDNKDDTSAGKVSPPKSDLKALQRPQEEHLASGTPPKPAQRHRRGGGGGASAVGTPARLLGSSLAVCALLALMLAAALFQRVYVSAQSHALRLEAATERLAQTEREAQRGRDTVELLKASVQQSRMSLSTMMERNTELGARHATALQQRDALEADNQRLAEEAERLRTELEEKGSGGEEEEEGAPPLSSSSSSSSDAEELRSRLTDMEKRLTFEQQRSALWERLYVQIQTKQTQTT